VRYGKARRSVADTAQMLPKTIPQSPFSPPIVNAVAAATRNTVYNIFRLTGEVVADVICALGAGSLKSSRKIGVNVVF